MYNYQGKLQLPTEIREAELGMIGGPQYGRPPPFAGFPGQNAPGMGAPPGMGKLSYDP